jgi:hypothetical protein
MPLLIPSSVPSGSWSNGGANLVLYCRMQAVKSGTIDEIKFYSNAAGNAKAGVYSDITGPLPGTILTGNNGSTSCGAAQLNSVAISDYSLVSGEWYWIAVLADTIGVATRDTGQSATSYFENRTYADGMPATAYIDSYVGYLFSYSGYGLLGGGKKASCIGF